MASFTWRASSLQIPLASDRKVAWPPGTAPDSDASCSYAQKNITMKHSMRGRGVVDQ
jgi:hypothetical protein